jgi:hypothetical protein
VAQRFEHVHGEDARVRVGRAQQPLDVLRRRRAHLLQRSDRGVAELRVLAPEEAGEPGRCRLRADGGQRGDDRFAHAAVVLRAQRGGEFRHRFRRGRELQRRFPPPGRRSPGPQRGQQLRQRAGRVGRVGGGSSGRAALQKGHLAFLPSTVPP